MPLHFKQRGDVQNRCSRKKKRARLKFKDQGVLASCSIYMQNDVAKEIQTAHRVGNHVMIGVLVKIQSKNTNMSYKVLWGIMGFTIPV